MKHFMWILVPTFIIAYIWLVFFTPNIWLLFACTFVGVFIFLFAALRIPDTKSIPLKILLYILCTVSMAPAAVLCLLMFWPVVKMLLDPVMIKHIINPLAP